MCNERRHNNVLYGSRKKRLDRKEGKKKKKKKQKPKKRAAGGGQKTKKERKQRTRKIRRKKQYSSVLQLMGYLSQECDCWPFSVWYTNRGIRYLMFAKPWGGDREMVGRGRGGGGGGKGDGALLETRLKQQWLATSKKQTVATNVQSHFASHNGQNGV